ncbi:hypothetical protein HY491_01310 [Candidatus Woesearchaeota archaeon]|nr:hypothetical protein [Candidatus Woesearchaeota archaeon]
MDTAKVGIIVIIAIAAFALGFISAAISNAGAAAIRTVMDILIYAGIMYCIALVLYMVLNRKKIFGQPSRKMTQREEPPLSR